MSAKDSFGSDASNYDELNMIPQKAKAIEDLDKIKSDIKTISTLPDVSASGTATIKFKGAAGSLTDGGAINTMTAAEIAVATAKGWTITFV